MTFYQLLDPPIEEAALEIINDADGIINEGDPFTLQYWVRAVPAANFTWSFNGTVINPSQHSDTITSQTLFDIYSTSTLPTIAAVSANSGIYTVNATNDYGSVTSQINVIVHCKLTLVDFLFNHFSLLNAKLISSIMKVLSQRFVSRFPLFLK